MRLAFDHVPAEMVETLTPGVLYGPAPQRGRFDGWRPVANTARRIADLARYAHPRYADAAFLRARMASAVMAEPRAARAGAARAAARARPRPAGSRPPPTPALAERTIAAALRYDRAIPTCAAVDAFMRGERPDVVLVTPIMKAPGRSST